LFVPKDAWQIVSRWVAQNYERVLLEGANAIHCRRFDKLAAQDKAPSLVNENPNHFQVLVTGEREDWGPMGAEPIEWKSLPVLRFERLSVSTDFLEHISRKPPEWIVFSSPRAAAFWSETLLATGYELPAETRVACLGNRTAQAAEESGFDVDFAPHEPGTEGFLKAFERTARPSSVLIPAAEGGRRRLGDRLRELGFEVNWFSLYRTLPRTDVAAQWIQLGAASARAIVFTSPSSVDAVLDVCELPPAMKVIAIGAFTGQHLEKRGFLRPPLLPSGDFSRIQEVL
jgi:uroporphyrinogen-III synthase